MSWFLIFSSAFIPILILAVMSMAESMRHDRTKLCTVNVPSTVTKRMRLTER
jgi:hypothetical protein